MLNLNFNHFLRRKPKYAILLCLEKFIEKPFEEFLEKLYSCRFWYAHVAPPSIQSCWSSFGCRDKSASRNEELSQEMSRLQEEIAEALHALADKLPAKGVQLDVFWYIPGATSIRVDENVAILGALKRLHAWHGAQISILQVDDHSSALSDWLSLLEARYIVLGKRKIPRVPRHMQGHVIWRGHLRLSEGKNNASLSLPGFQISSRHIDPTFAFRPTRSKDVVKGMHVLSDWIEVIDIVNLEEVPRSFLVAEQMHLSIPAESILPRSFHFLLWLTSKGVEKKTAIIAELPYITCNTPVPDSVSAGIGTSAWKQQLAKNPLDFSIPEIKMKAKDGCEYLLIYPGPSGKCIVQPFVSLTKLNGAVAAQVAEMTSYGRFGIHRCPPTVVNHPIRGIPLITDEYFKEFLTLVDNYSRHGVLRLRDKRLKRGCQRDITPKELRVLFGLILDRFLTLSPFERGAIGLFEDKCQSVLDNSNPVSDPDAELVLERLALINGEQVREKMKREMHELQLAGMMVPPPLQDTITLHLDASEFLKHFHPSGLPTGQDFSPIGIATKSQSHTSTPSKHSTRPNLGQEELKKLSFIDTLKYNLPGIHYCIGQEAVNNDLKMSRLIQRVVTMETASTCSQDATTSVIKLQRRRSVNRSASKRKIATPRKSRSKYNSKSPRHLKRLQLSGSGKTNKNRNKTSSEDHVTSNLSGKITPRKNQNQRKQQTLLTPRKSMRIASPLKGLDENVVTTPRKSERLSTPKKLKNEETPTRRSKRLDTPKKDTIATNQSKIIGALTPGRSNIRRTPRKQGNASPYKANQSPWKQAMPSNLRRSSLPTLAESSKRGRLVSRSEKHKRKLMEIVSKVLAAKGVDKAHIYYKKCLTRLYELSKSYVKDLKSSRGLYKEMEQIAENNVDIVVKFELRSKSTS